jgi:hypothetical protein
VSPPRRRTWRIPDLRPDLHERSEEVRLPPGASVSRRARPLEEGQGPGAPAALACGAGVGSTRVSNGKQKGKGNTKNGNKYLDWAYVEAANFAERYNPQIQRYYQRKRTKTKGVVAIKAVAHKLARACYHRLRDGTARGKGHAGRFTI